MRKQRHSAFVFATPTVQCLYFLNPKFRARLYSSVCVMFVFTSLIVQSSNTPTYLLLKSDTCTVDMSVCRCCSEWVESLYRTSLSHKTVAVYSRTALYNHLWKSKLRRASPGVLIGILHKRSSCRCQCFEGRRHS